MLHAVKKTDKRIKEVLDNLRIEDETEMYLEFGENWKNIVFDSAIKSDIEIMVDEENNSVGFYGIRELDHDTAEVCLLTSDKLKNNTLSFIFGAKRVVKKWLKQYKRLQNYIYKHNRSGIRWLKMLGFTLNEFDDKRMYFFIGE